MVCGIRFNVHPSSIVTFLHTYGRCNFIKIIYLLFDSPIADRLIPLLVATLKIIAFCVRETLEWSIWCMDADKIYWVWSYSKAKFCTLSEPVRMTLKT